MALLSLRVMSVVICVILTLITAALTLTVSTAFTTKAVDDIGQRYSSSLATNLKTNVVSYLQKAVEQYYAMAQYTSTGPVALPNTTWSPTWNGSYWTFNTTDVSSVNLYLAMMLQTMVSHNFTRESTALMCFADGTMLLVSENTFLPGAKYLTSTTVGLPDGRPIDLSSPTYANAIFYRSDNKPATYSFVTPPANSWALPASNCESGTGVCSVTECRTFTQSLRAYTLGPRRCFWVDMQITVWPTVSTGVACTMFDSRDRRIGMTGSLMSLTAVSAFVAETQRTSNGQAFVVDSTNGGLLGSTSSLPYQGTWRFTQATFDRADHSLRNSSLLPIKLQGVGTSTMDQRDSPFVGALFMNATYVKIKPNCRVGTVNSHIVCQETVDTYGYQPLRSLRDAVGLDPAAGFRQGSVTADGESYYYAVDGIATHLEGAEVPGLRWSVVVLTPQNDVLGEVTKGRTYSIAATCCFFVFAALCCFVLFTIFLRPLVELEDKMLLTASFADDSDKAEDVSALSEIRNMQKSFYKMRAQLRKLKSFVPQSVLAALDDGEEEDELDADMVAISPPGENVERANEADRELRGAATGSEDALTHRSTARSHRSASSRTGSSELGAVVRALNTQVGLTRRVVSILVLNVMGLHAFVKGLTPDEVTLMHSKLVEAFCSIISSGKGIVDGFQGDRFVATFNAVTSNAQHAVRAAVAAQEVLAAFSRLKTPFERAGVGIATGDALVGNGGCETMRRFCTIGRVYTQATVMERLTKQFPTADIVLTQAAAGQLAHEFYLEALDVVQLEGRSKPTLVYALRERMNHAMEEWNYAMQQNESKDKYGKLNEAFKVYGEGDSTQARAVLEAVPDASRQCAGYNTLASLLQENVEAAGRASTAQGPFFQRCYGPAPRR